MLTRIGSTIDLCVMHVLFLIFWIIRRIQNVRRTSIPAELPLNLHRPILNLPMTVDIPVEVWTEIFKFFSRKTLVRHVQPVNHWFKEICDKNVKNLHVIYCEGTKNFLKQLSNFEPEAIQKLKDLADNNCPLACHFRITYIHASILNNEEIQDILLHCLDMFQGCHLTLTSSRKASSLRGELLLAYLNRLEAVRANQIFLDFFPNFFRKTKLKGFLQHPTLLNCPRLIFYGQILDSNIQDIFDWLHHRVADKPDDNDVDGSHGIRCFVVSSEDLSSSLGEHLECIQWLLQCCVQNLHHTRDPSNCRQFILSFKYFGPPTDLDNFERVENPSTGEVLLLERVIDAHAHNNDNDDHIYLPYYPFDDYVNPNSLPNFYRFTRCLAKQIGHGTEELYAKVFKSFGRYNFEDERGDMATYLTISN